MTKELDYLAKVFGEATAGDWELRTFAKENSTWVNFNIASPYGYLLNSYAVGVQADGKNAQFIATCGTLKDEIKAVIEAAHKVTGIEDKFGSENSIFIAIHELSGKLQDLKSKIAGLM